MHLGCVANSFNTRINATQKLLPQGDSASLIPRVSLRNVLLGLGRNDQISGHNGFGLFA